MTLYYHIIFLTARNITHDKINFWNLFNLFILILDTSSFGIQI